MGYRRHMRLHISLADDLVAELDRRAGPRNRSAFVVAAVQQALADDRRWEALRASVGALSGRHDWDDDPQAWVHAQRHDPRRAG
ncbi:MAG: hypothetical protein NVSMB55_08290 [Mycobacteriales bacterium]